MPEQRELDEPIGWRLSMAAPSSIPFLTKLEVHEREFPTEAEARASMATMKRLYPQVAMCVTPIFLSARRRSNIRHRRDQQTVTANWPVQHRVEGA